MGDQGYKPDDDYWGNGSANALIAFQTQYGIAHDGCAGTNTWNAMRGYVTSRCSPGYVCNTPNNQVSIAGRLAYYERTNCDWGTYIASGPQGGPTRAGGDYSFSSSLGPVVSCA